MGLRDIFGNKHGENEAPVEPAAPAVPPIPVKPTGGLLNLEKNEILNLTKSAPGLERIRVAAGWDFAGRKAYDLDVAAYLCDGRQILNTVYYAGKTDKGISLDGDNLTGEGDGDDETITINLKELHEKVNRIVFAVVIFRGGSKNQYFEGVENAFTRVIDDTNGGKELCRVELTKEGGRNTAVVMGELTKDGSEWSFRAIKQFSIDSIESLKKTKELFS